MTKTTTTSKHSPIYNKWSDLKTKHPGATILLRAGDFYETYNEDAEKLSKILGITLTKSSKYMDMSMAGFPYHCLDQYLPIIIRNGCRVAIHQLDDLKPTIKRGENSNNNVTIKNNKIMEEKVQQQFIGIATETMRALNGNIPASLNQRLSDAIGQLDYIRLKFTHNAKITNDEMNEVLRLAEIGRQGEEACKVKK